MIWTDSPQFAAYSASQVTAGTRCPSQTYLPPPLPPSPVKRSLEAATSSSSFDHAIQMSSAVDGLLSLRGSTVLPPPPQNQYYKPQHSLPLSVEEMPSCSSQRRSPINMERLWSGDKSQLSHNDGMVRKPGL